MAERRRRTRQLVKQLNSLVAELHHLYPDRRFTLDGHLVGSIGEVLAAARYRLDLLPASTPAHDAKAPDGRLVQVKATQGDRVALRARPNHLIVLKLLRNGEIEEIYNGPGALAWRHVGARQSSNGQCPISVAKLRHLMEAVPDERRLRDVAA